MEKNARSAGSGNSGNRNLIGKPDAAIYGRRLAGTSERNRFDPPENRPFGTTPRTRRNARTERCRRRRNSRFRRQLPRKTESGPTRHRRRRTLRPLRRYSFLSEETGGIFRTGGTLNIPAKRRCAESGVWRSQSNKKTERASRDSVSVFQNARTMKNETAATARGMPYTAAISKKKVWARSMGTPASTNSFNSALRTLQKSFETACGPSQKKKAVGDDTNRERTSAEMAARVWMENHFSGTSKTVATAICNRAAAHLNFPRRIVRTAA